MDLGQGSRDSGRTVLSQRRSQVSILGCSSAFWPQPHLPPFFPSYPAVPVGITPTVGCRVFAVSQPLHGSLFIFPWSAWRPRAHSAEPNSIIPSPLCFCTDCILLHCCPFTWIYNCYIMHLPFKSYKGKRN